MKTKTVFFFSVITGALGALLRVLQYVLVIDKTGYYDPQTGFEKALVYALPALLGIGTAYALCLLFAGDKNTLCPKNVLCGPAAGVLLVLAAAVMTGDAGIGIGHMLVSKTVNAVTLLELPTALFFALAGCRAFLFGKEASAFMRVLGLVPPIYAVLFAVTQFFGSFEQAHVSRSKLLTLATCALALLFITTNAVCAGAELKRKRLDAACLVCVLFCAPNAAGDVFALATGRLGADNLPQTLLFALLLALFTLFSLVLLAHPTKAAVPVQSDAVSDDRPNSFEDGDEIENIKKYIDSIDSGKEE